MIQSRERQLTKLKHDRMKKKKTINEEEQAPHVEPNITVQEEELKICMENQIHKKTKIQKNTSRTWKKVHPKRT